MSSPDIPQIRLYQNWLRDARGLSFDSYDALWRWSTTDLDAFWQSIWDYFDLQSPTPHSAVLGKRQMPGAEWFPGAQVNYAQHILSHAGKAHAAGLPALVSHNEKSLAADLAPQELSWPELKRQVASLALHLKAQGVEPGDRVAAYLPNIPETIVAFMAVASIGGVWSVCAPDMGTNSVLDRFRQIEPKVLIACDGVTYGGRDMDRTAVVAELRAALPSVQHVIVHYNLGTVGVVAGSTRFTDATASSNAQTQAFEPMWLPFDHPLWIVYSSGTTGLPKPIVHGHGGVMIVALALLRLNNDVAPSAAGKGTPERFFWYSSTGWIMWNVQAGALLNGTTTCIFDGNPAGSNKDQPDWTTLWRFAAGTGVTFFGAGAAFYANCMKAGVDLSACGNLSKTRTLGATGSPLSPEAQSWGTEEFRKLHIEIWWCNISGGTDFAGAFISGNRELPVVPGEMQCRVLGCAVEAWNEKGEAVIDEVGELVCVQPLPSMPLHFWGDQGNQRYLSSYFDMYPGVWRHGDWLKITPQGSCIIYGRSDATINRYGLRMGTSELYSAIEALPEVLDSMVVDLEFLGRESYMPLFVVLRPGMALDDAMKTKLNNAVKTALSPRFVPNEIFAVPEIPRTLSGKKQELPIKKLLLGESIEKVINRDAMANPGSLDWYVDFAKLRAAQG
ncbi:MAG: acetoacetate--CoA ligase [Polaromonas sp.]|uniref:acetoacetate--CoA ligase n=1 Tax=Polaromonas sp. TaxID=1869339 RepID=UPI0025F8E475|nr:acetoacetate--CoA ligase [Polaromonas sp.]MBI2727721.1 acetoacetate--CoA ligase [Polaromonas sp.]